MAGGPSAWRTTPGCNFNLNEDPYKEMNLARLHHYRPERRKMIARLKQGIAETVDRFALPDN